MFCGRGASCCRPKSGWYEWLALAGLAPPAVQLVPMPAVNQAQGSIVARCYLFLWFLALAWIDASVFIHFVSVFAVESAQGPKRAGHFLALASIDAAVLVYFVPIFAVEIAHAPCRADRRNTFRWFTFAIGCAAILFYSFAICNKTISRNNS